MSHTAPLRHGTPTAGRPPVVTALLSALPAASLDLVFGERLHALARGIDWS